MWSDRIALNFGLTKYELYNLMPNSYYEIEITARNDFGLSASQPYRIKTLTGAASKTSF
jgi:hypothetical protein